MKKIIFFCLYILFLNKSYSCSCYNGLPSLWEYNETEQIFKGKVIDIIIHEAKFRKTIKFLILNSIKGKFNSDTINVLTGLHGTACGLQVYKNETWVIFSNKGSTSSCKGNILVSDSSQSIPLYYEEFRNRALYRLDSIVNLPDQYIKKYEGGHLVLEGKIRKSKPEGYWNYYFGENFYGDHKVYYKNGVRDSVCFSFYDNNNIRSECRYKDGIRHGKFVEYYPNMVIRESGYYLNGNYHGEYNVYYEEGQLKEKKFYMEGKASGIWLYYDINGTVTRRIEMETE